MSNEWSSYNFPKGIVQHRETWVVEIAEPPRTAYFHGDTRVAVVKLDSDLKWWIVPYFTDEEHLMDDMGPFDTADDAIIMVKLSSEKSAVDSLAK